MTNIFLEWTRRAGSRLGVVGLVVMLAACVDLDDDRIEPIPLGYVSLYNAVPDAPALDISVDERRVNSSTFDYADYSGYLNFRTGDRKLKFTSVNAANTLVDTTLQVVAGNTYSVFLINRLANVETLLTKDSAAAPSKGNAMIRFIQLSPDAPQLDVEYTAETSTSWIADAKFKDASDFKEVAGKTYTIKVKDAASGETLLSALNVYLRPGGYYTIITRGFATPPAGNTNGLSLEVL